MRRINKFIVFLLLLSLILLVISFYLESKRTEYFSNKLELHNWWLGDKKDEKSEAIFGKLFEDVKFDSVKIYSIFGEPDFQKQKEENFLYVQYSGESSFKDPSVFDINFIPGDKNKNTILFPHAYQHILYNELDIQKLLTRRTLDKNKKYKFCLFSVSNGSCKQRNEIFTELSKYKKVDSCGSFMNNIDKQCPDNHNSSAYFDFISDYKFMICFENKSIPNYLTEKLINAYYSGAIPIYWGCPEVKNYVNMDAILYLPPNYTPNQLNELISKIKQLDNDEASYKMMYERAFFKDGKLPDEFNLEKIKQKVSNLLQLHR